jgi:hypothetical protein
VRDVLLAIDWSEVVAQLQKLIVLEIVFVKMGVFGIRLKLEKMPVKETIVEVDWNIGLVYKLR